jgi:hypothetical protein
MSIDEAGSEKTFKAITSALESPAGKEAVKAAVKGTRSRPAKKRRYHETTVYKGKTAEIMGYLHEAGHTVEFVIPSPDIMGFEILSYTEE